VSGRVLHVATSLDFGGVETHLVTIARARARARYEPVFSAIAGGGAAAAAIRDTGARVECLGRRAAIPSPGAFAGLVGLMRGLRPDVMHAHGAEANFHALPAAALAGVPVRIGEEIGIPAHGRLARLGFAASYRFAHAVVGVSEGVSRWLVDSGEVPAGKSVTLLNPVQLPEGRGDVVPPAGRLRFCHVGRLEAVKNLEVLLQAFARFSRAHGEAELWLVGDGSLRRALEQQAQVLGITERVRFIGFDPEPARWLRQCHVGVQCSLSEGFGLAMVEAMGCELPVLSTRVGAAPDVIVDGSTGWLVDGYDAAALREGMERVAASSGDDLLAMGRRARDAVHAMFTPADYLSRVESLYAAVAAGRGAP
jgi:glycosyltransferase involved in cell wall biosynthesis